MYRTIRSLSCALLLALSAPAMGAPSLFKSTGAKLAPDSDEQPVAVLEASAFESIVGQKINVAAPGETAVWASYTKHQELDDENLLWVGSVTTPLGNQRAIVVFGPDGAYGVVPDAQGKLWSLKSHASGRSWLEPMNGIVPSAICPLPGCRNQLATDAIPFVPAKKDGPGVRISDKEAERLSTTKSQIDLLGIYTDDVVRLYGSDSAAMTYFRSLVAMANQSLSDSGVNAFYEVVSLVRSSHDTNISNFNTLIALRENKLSDGLDVNALRNTHAADLVAMLREGASNLGSGGIANLATDPNFIPQDFGFSVSAFGGYVMAHELGHNLGANHDIETETRSDGSIARGAYPFAHGHREAAPLPFHTVMAYRAGQMQEQPYFSNPNLWACRGRPCGIEGISDNARAINLMAPRIARIRDRNASLTINDVEDLEPDNGEFARFIPARIPLPAPAGGFSFDVWSEDGTAKAGEDYRALTRTRYTIAEGQRETLIRVTTNPDRIREPTETFYLVAETQSGATTQRSRSEVRILNDDPRLRYQGRLIFEGAPPPTGVVYVYATESASFSSENAVLTPPNFEYDLGLLPGVAYDLNFDASQYPPFTEQRRFVRLGAVSRNENNVMTAGRRVTGRLKFEGAPAPNEPIVVTGWGITGQQNTGRGRSINPPDYRFDVSVASGTPFRIAVNRPPSPFVPSEIAFRDSAEVNGEVELVVSTVPTVRIDQGSVNENSSDAMLYINVATAADSLISRNTNWQISYGWRIVGGTATPGQDFSGPTSGRISIIPGEPNSFISIPIINDGVAEPDETIEIEIFDVTGARLAGSRSTSIIADDDRPTPSAIGLLDASVYEGDTGNRSMTFTARLDRPADQPVRFDVQTKDDTARAGADYVGTTLRGLEIPAGQLEVRFQIPVVGDTLSEPAERFTAQMTNVIGARLDWPEATALILDDDNASVATSVLNSALEVDSDAGHVDIVLGGLPALPDARFPATRLVSPERVQTTLNADQAALYWINVPAGGSSTTEAIIHAAIEAPDNVRLLVGPDAGSSDPSDASASCSQTSTSGGTYCAIRVRRDANAPATRYWVRVRNGGASSPVTTELAFVPMLANSTLVATGPGVAPRSDDIDVRVSWNDPTFLTGQSRVGYLTVETSPGERVYFEPVRLRRTGSNDAPRVLVPESSQTLSLNPGATHQRVLLTLPPYASGAQISTRAVSGASGTLRLEAVHAPSPQSPGIAVAPPGAPEVVSTGTGLTQALTLTSSVLASRSGRWYIRLINTGTTRADVEITTTMTTGAGAAPIASGSYFNPDRPGHGLFIYPAGNQWAGLWYTYLEDSSTTWYYVQAAAPGPNGIWNGTIFRAAWNGSSNHLTEIGTMVVTPRASGEFSLAVTMDGYTSEQRMAPFLSGCPVVGGNPLNASAHWFEPALAGYGFSVQVNPSYEFIASFLYDAEGRPRFLTAERGGAFASAAESMPLSQLQGFAPLGQHSTPRRAQIGTLTRRYNADGLVSIGQTANLVGNVRGSWQRNAPVTALTLRQGCAPR